MSGVELIRIRSIVSMKLRTLLFYSIIALISVVILRAKDACCTERSRELERRITALYKTVDFMTRRPHQMNVDAIFGLALTEAHVRRTINHKNMKYFDRHFVQNLVDVLDRCHRARRKAIAVVPADTKLSSTLNRIISKPDIWLRPISWSFGLLGPRPQPSEHNSESSVLGYFFKGSPNETESDKCILQLADDSANSVCQVSDSCANMLIKNDQPRGYPLTHRLLYVQTAIVLGCKERSYTPFKKLIPAYCATILQDAVDMEDANLPAVSRDLICEQVLLCGMEGFTEFANDHYAKLILSWQNFAGCFSSFGFGEKSSQKRLKRESESMDYGCDNHATSLGAASLSLLIRHLVETFA